MGAAVKSNIKIVSFGEAMLEHSENDEVPSYAGDTINFLKAAQIAGAEAYFVSQIANDEVGNSLAAFLKKNSIDIQYCPRKAGKTGSYKIKLNKDGEREFTYDRKASLAALIQPDQLAKDIMSNKQLLYLSGISLAISKTAEATARELIRQALDNQLPIAYDINFRDKLTSISEASDLILQMINRLKFCFLSEDDIAVVNSAFKLDHNLSTEFLLLKLKALVPTCEWVLKLGAKGAYSTKAMNEGSHKVIRSQVPSVKATDTSGAGDVFNGVYLFHRMNSESVQESLNLAAEFAAAHVQKHGAFPSQ